MANLRPLTPDDGPAIAALGDQTPETGALAFHSVFHIDPYAALQTLRPGTAELFDICVPRSQIVGHVEFIQELEERLRIQLPTYGHAADGNVHTHYMHRILEDGVLGGGISGWRENREAVRKALYDDAINRGGVISGEHGIGEVKRPYLERNLGSDTLAAMRSIKSALDPKNILNPGKIFDS